MRHLNKTATKIFRTLIQEANQKHFGNSVKFDNAPGTYMALHVCRTGQSTFSLAHYGEQNGDLMRDPDIDFWVAPAGEVYPWAYRNDYVSMAREYVTFSAAALPVRFERRAQADLAEFCNGWMKNIREQQGITPAKEAA